MKWKNLYKVRQNTLESYKAKTPYEILMVPKNASYQEIEKAWKKMLKTYHPDVADSFLKTINEEITKILNNAHDFLIAEKHGK